jgi:cation:H+ antiporter
MLEQLGQFALGLVLLALGADSLVKGAAGLALRFGVSPFLVGLVVVGFGTSAPELSVNLSAVYNGTTDIALGNVVGSNIANVGLILGLSALAAPLVVQMRLLRFETPLLVAVSGALWLLAYDGTLGRLDGAILLAGFLALMALVARDARREPAAVQAELGAAAQTRTETWRGVLRVAIGLALLVLGAQWMVDAAVALAIAAGLSQLIVGLTIVAIGTSLPELASSVLAALRGHSDIAIGNVVGSCLFNILLILGSTAAAAPLPVAHSLVVVEIPAMIAFAIVLYPMMRGDLRIERHEGGALVAAYLAFLALQVWLIARA